METQLFKSVKAIFMKESFDFTCSNIDLYNFHPQLRIFIIPMGIFFNNPNSTLRYIWPFVSVSLSIIACTIEGMSALHFFQIQNYAIATECFCYCLLLGVIPFIYISTILGKSQVIKLINDMNNDFLFISKLGSRYRDRFLNGQLLIWQLCLTWLCFTAMIAVMYPLMTSVYLLYVSIFITQDEHQVRPLMFSMWLPKDDPYRTPNYEIFFILETNYCILYVQSFVVYVYILFHVMLHNYYLLDMILLDFEMLFDGLDETTATLPRHDSRRIAVQMTLNNRIKRIATWHQSVFNSIASMSSVLGPPLVYQVVFSGIAICLIAYQVVEKLGAGTLDLFFSMLLIAAIIQLWIPCFIGTVLRDKAFEVADAAWNCGWHETALGRLVRLDLLIIILRAQQPLSIKFIGLQNVALETFSSNMSSAYTYFNMLRQYN
uniref:Odorant receptor n=1 Tax=Leucinodes orbonalis TaxID=711050 RepID=A0AAU0QKB2_9NEOP|nr:odorant receptor [Leucinodes orbonalis]